MLAAASRPLVRMVDRYLPDPFIFVLILTLIVFAAAVGIQGTSPLAVVRMWGDGFWELLTFSMQMLLVLATGYMLASSPPVQRMLAGLASRAASPGAAIVMVSVVSLTASWINWGFGLVVGALFAKELARQVRVDYRLLVASAYSGFVVWHGGLAGSIPLAIATPGHPFEAATGLIGTSQTIFAPFNLIIVALLFLLIPTVNRMMLPAPDDSVYVDPARLDTGAGDDEDSVGRPADWLETSRGLAWLIGAAGVIWLVMYFVGGGGLTLNVVNFLFLTMAIILHGTPRRLLAALNEAIRGGSGIVIQFPFYAGIMAIMVGSGLAATVSQSLVSIASAETLPFWTFLSAGIVNIFVPSGGGQWAVQAPVVLPAAQALGVDPARVAMSVAWGDAWTNLIQPFWALPVLAIAGLAAKDIMGFCLMHLVLSGVVIAVGLTFF